MPIVEDEETGRQCYVEPDRTSLLPRTHHRESRIPYFHRHYLKVSLYDTPLDNIYAIQLLIEDYWFCEFLESEFRLDIHGETDQRHVRETRRKVELDNLDTPGYPFGDVEACLQTTGDAIMTVFAACHPNPLTGNQLSQILLDSKNALISHAMREYCPCHRGPFEFPVVKAELPLYYLSATIMELTENQYLQRTSYGKIRPKHKRFSYRYWPF